MITRHFSIKIRKYLSILILIVFGFWATIYIRENSSAFTAITNIPALSIVTLFIICFGILVCNGLILKHILRIFKIDSSFKEWMSITIISTAFNFITPFKGGAGFRALYLKRVHQFDLIYFISTFSVMFLVQAFVNSVIGILCFSFFLLKSTPVRPIIGLWFILIIIVSLFILRMNFKFKKSHKFPINYIVSILNGFAILRKSPSEYRLLIIYTSLYSLLSILHFKITFYSIGINMSWVAVSFYSATQNVAALIPLTPGGLGVLEAISIYISQSLSYSTSEALMVQGLTRCVFLSLVFFLTPFCMRYLTLSSSSIIKKSRDKDDMSI